MRTVLPCGLGHLELAEAQVSAVDPVRHHRMAHGALGLGDLVLVVREDQVDPAGVDVEPLAEVLHRHRRALDVPAGEAFTPRAVPSHEPVRARLLPEREVGVELLPGVDLELLAVSGPKLVERVARELPVALEGLNVVVDGPVHLVRVAVLDQPLGELEHLRDVVGRLRVLVRALQAELRGVFEERACVLLDDLGRRQALIVDGELHAIASGVRRLVGHVTHVGDVEDLRDLVALELERPTEQVREQERPQVPDVRVSVDGRAARVHADVTVVQGDDFLQRSRQRVVEAHGDRSILVVSGLSRGTATPVGEGRIPARSRPYRLRWDSGP